MKKINFLCTLSVIGAISLTSCSLFGKKSKDKEAIDDTKAQLEISTFDGGVGDEWLKNAADLFVQQNKDRTDFEDGKVGVQITIKKETVGGDTLVGQELKRDMYFTENVDYYRLTNDNKFADITDILTEANPNDGNKTILSKIDNNLKQYMNRDGKYYAVPFYDCIYGLVYDKDLFAEKSFYMTDSGEFTNDRAQFGKGPNNIAGDWDDGLPKTYTQFASMMNRMRQNNVTPFVYSDSAEVSRYTARGLMSYWSDDEGFANTQLNYSFNGHADHIITSFNEGTPVISGADITKQNGYLLRKQAGIYNALNFADTVLCSDKLNYTGAADNKAAQNMFVNNKDSMGSGEQPIAMMFEGTWWEHEATEAFEVARRTRDSFNYGVMAIPKSSESKVGEDATFLNQNKSYGFIASNTKHMKLAKEFFKFLHTDEQLRQFTLTTSMTRGLDYTLESGDLSKLTTFAKDLVDIKQSEHAKLLYPVCGEKFFIDRSDVFDAEPWVWGTVNKGENPIPKFIADASLTAEAYFQQHYEKITESQWLTIVNQ